MYCPVLPPLPHTFVTETMVGQPGAPHGGNRIILLCGNLPGLLWVILRAQWAKVDIAQWLLSNFWNSPFSSHPSTHIPTWLYLASRGRLRLNLHKKSIWQLSLREAIPSPLRQGCKPRCSPPRPCYLSQPLWNCYYPLSHGPWAPLEQVVQLIHISTPSAWSVLDAPSNYHK